jgi:hypothetical protein
LLTLKQEKLVWDWRRRQQSKAAVKVAIEEALDQLPESYSTEAYQRKCQEVYQHVYECYSEAGIRIYTTATWSWFDILPGRTAGFQESLLRFPLSVTRLTLRSFLTNAEIDVSRGV